MDGLAGEMKAAEAVSRTTAYEGHELADRRASELEAALESQAKLVGAVEDLTAALADRLSPVLGHSQPTEAKPTGADSPFASQRANAVFDHNERLGAISRRLRDMLDRAEV